MLSTVKGVSFCAAQKETQGTAVHFCSTRGTRPDSFERKEDKANNGKFDWSEARKNFLKGIISPVTALIKHPVITAGVVGATALACALVPVLAPVTAIGFGALSLYQLGKGGYNAAKLYKNGQYDDAEKAFDEIGQGTIGVALTAVGVKQSAKVAKEAKMMSELNVNSLTNAQKQAISLEVKEGSFGNAIKEIGSLFTTKSGFKAVLNQFKPSQIAQRGKDVLNFLFKREDVVKIKEEKMRFSETTEGKRRAQLSSEEIEQEINALYKEAFDEYGIPEEIRPKLEITKNDMKHGGGYCSSTHTIQVNETSYREGAFDLPNIIKHESTHANEAILRQRLPMEDKERLAQEFFLDKIKNGEKENIIVEAGFMGIKTGKAPILNEQMKADFSQLAKEKLYMTDKFYSNQELIEMVRPIVESNPEFVARYPSEQEALNAMVKYAKSHNFRYNIAMKQSTGFNTNGIDTSLLKPLSAEEKEYAIRSFVNGIDCVESNVAGQGNILGLGGDYNQYQFCTEEVMAQQKGNSFEIAKLNEQLEALRSRPNYDLAEEARLLDQIRMSELTIEYKVKGARFYELYTESKNHPENKALARQVSRMKNELDVLLKKINKISHVQGDDILGLSVHVEGKEYIARVIRVPKKGGATIHVPYNVLVVQPIVEENVS